MTFPDWMDRAILGNPLRDFSRREGRRMVFRTTIAPAA